MGMLSNQWGFHGANGKLELRDRKAEGNLEQSGNASTARLQNGHRRQKTKLENFSAAKDFFTTATERIDLNIYIIGAGA